MAKIDVKAKDTIKSIFSSHVDSQGRLKGSPENLYREILPLLPGDISLADFEAALLRSRISGKENLKKGFNQFTKSLEIWTKTTDRTKARPQEKKHPQMRLDDCNRLMAIARRPDYIEDWNCLLGETNRKRSNYQKFRVLYKTLCQKWKLKSPISPYLRKEGKNSESIFKANQLEPVLELTEQEWPDNFIAIGRETTDNCLFVRLRIDLTKGEKGLLKAFKGKIKSWMKNIPKEKKPRKTKYDPWEIWDLHEKSRLSLLQIARQKDGKGYPPGSKPTVPDVLWPPYKRVERAYKQAQKMIQIVNPPYPFPIKSLVDV